MQHKDVAEHHKQLGSCPGKSKQILGKHEKAQHKYRDVQRPDAGKTLEPALSYLVKVFKIMIDIGENKARKQKEEADWLCVCEVFRHIVKEDKYAFAVIGNDKSSCNKTQTGKRIDSSFAGHFYPLR